MVDHLLYLTGNPVKLQTAQAALAQFGIRVEQAQLALPEIQSENVVEIAEFSARFAGQQLNRLLLVSDVAFEIRALNGFPGPYVKYINQWLPPGKLLRLMQDEADRYAQFVDALSLYQPGCGCANFLSTTPGVIAHHEQGKNGWGIDTIFIPDGYTDTLASLTDRQKLGVWKQTHWEQLGRYLQSIP